MNSRLLSDSELAVEMISDRDRPEEPIPFVDTGQNQHNLQLTCPSPPSHGTGSMPPMKRSPSPLEGSGSEQHTKKKRPQSGRENPADDEAVSAEGSDSVDSTLTTTDHPASVGSIQTTIDPPATMETMESEGAGLLKIEKLPPEDLKISGLIDYCPKTNTLKYLILSNRKQYISLILKIISYTLFTPLYHPDSTIIKVFSSQYIKVVQSLNPEEKNKVQNKNQFAFYFLRKKGAPFTEPSRAYFPADGGKIHSEEFIVSEIQRLIDNNEITEYSELWIYTLNSPCMGKVGTDPCMIQITLLSNQLGRRYQIKTIIAFSKYYGPSGSIVRGLPAHTYRACSCSSFCTDSTDIKDSAQNYEPSLTLNMNKKRNSKFRRKRCDSLPTTNLNKLPVSSPKIINQTYSNIFPVTSQLKNFSQPELQPSTIIIEEDHQFKKNSSKCKSSVSLLDITPNEPERSHINKNYQLNYEPQSDQHPFHQQSQTTDYNELLELARNKIITAEDRQSRFLLKNSSRFKTNNVINLIKENFPKDKLKIFFDIINNLITRCPNSSHTFEEYEKMGLESTGEFEKSVRALISEEFPQSACNSICETFRSEFLSWWKPNVEQSYSAFLNRRLSEGFNKKAVQLFNQNIQSLPFKPYIVCIDDITGSHSTGCTDDITGSQSIGCTDDITGSQTIDCTNDIIGYQNICCIDDITGSQSIGCTDDITGSQSIGWTDDITGSQSIGCTDDITGSHSTGCTDDITGSQSIDWTDDITGSQSIGCTDDITGSQSIGCTDDITGSQSIGCTNDITGSQAIDCTNDIIDYQNIGCIDDIADFQKIGYTDDITDSQSIDCTDDITGSQTIDCTNEIIDYQNIGCIDDIADFQKIGYTDDITDSQSIDCTDDITGSQTIDCTNEIIDEQSIGCTDDITN
ncbi:uncharacterized protein [Salminus brasiliensis]|uniref:uncharacterized protein n=1 Tax=Salminus brasiliensis TaxID=930266 RepID=UPI003B83673F